MRGTFLDIRPSALKPALCALGARSVGQLADTHVLFVGHQSVQAWHIEQRPTGKTGTAVAMGDNAKTTESKTSAKGAGMYASLRNRGGVPPRGRPV